MNQDRLSFTDGPDDATGKQTSVTAVCRSGNEPVFISSFISGRPSHSDHIQVNRWRLRPTGIHPPVPVVTGRETVEQPGQDIEESEGLSEELHLLDQRDQSAAFWTKQVTAGCPAVCECPAEPLVCHPGVSTVPDGCSCCKVCAAQLNEDCSLTRPCDHHKGLECNYGNDVTVAWGVCRARSEGRTCEYNGRMYQNGESFRAGCKHQCTCIDGAVGCAPLCNNKLPPASPSCPYPRLVRIPGQCCFSVDCHKGAWLLPPKHQVPPGHQHLPKPPDHQLGNELNSEHADVRSSGWSSEHGYKHLPAWNHLKEKNCPVQTTEWTHCSRSCGMGISSRITNRNPQCKLERETRICTVRPCGGVTLPTKKGKKCTQAQKSPKPIHLSYGECVSVRPYRPTHCGVCTDGRCCSPRRTRTVPVTFVCADGERFQRSAMFIQSCKCSSDCGHLNDVVLPPQYRMYGDTHKFKD